MDVKKMFSGCCFQEFFVQPPVGKTVPASRLIFCFFLKVSNLMLLFCSVFSLLAHADAAKKGDLG